MHIARINRTELINTLFGHEADLAVLNLLIDLETSTFQRVNDLEESSEV